MEIQARLEVSPERERLHPQGSFWRALRRAGVWSMFLKDREGCGVEKELGRDRSSSRETGWKPFLVGWSN